MSENIIWALEGKIRANQKETFDALMNEMIHAVSKEEGTLNYEWSLGEDKKSLYVYERYIDLKAAKEHLNTWEVFAPRFMNIVDIERIVVYSNLDEELKAALVGATFMTPIGGFKRK